MNESSVIRRNRKVSAVGAVSFGLDSRYAPLVRLSRGWPSIFSQVRPFKVLASLSPAAGKGHVAFAVFSSGTGLVIVPSQAAKRQTGKTTRSSRMTPKVSHSVRSPAALPDRRIIALVELSPQHPGRGTKRP